MSGEQDIITYSVMQSDGNSFCGDVISDTFNKASRDEDNILELIYKKKYVYVIFMLKFKLLKIFHEN